MIKYGINVGSIGNKAVFYIESNTLFSNKDLYDDFYDKYIELTKLSLRTTVSSAVWSAFLFVRTIKKD